jgi:Na+-transporting NADH:ubiquinone oxidoreductase subunit NqrC
MEKKNTKKNNSNAVGLVVLGASLAGLAAGAYFFLGPKGQKNQKHAKAWAIKMKADVIEKLETAREVSEPVYNEIIDSVAKEYEKNKKAGHGEVDIIVQDLKKHWKTISKIAKSAKHDAVKDAHRVAKKANK